MLGAVSAFGTDKVESLGREVVDNVDGFVGGQEGDAGAVAEEAEVAVVGNDVDRSGPDVLGSGCAARSGVVDGGNVDA